MNPTVTYYFSNLFIYLGLSLIEYFSLSFVYALMFHYKHVPIMIFGLLFLIINPILTWIITAIQFRKTKNEMK